MSKLWFYRVRGPWASDDWLLADDEVAAEQLSRNKCDVSIVWVEGHLEANRVEFECIDCGKDVDRPRGSFDIPGVTPKRCASCTADRMEEVNHA